VGDVTPSSFEGRRPKAAGAPAESDNLEAELLQAHRVGDKHALVELYTLAADQAAHVDAACFYLTHAYIFALDADDPRKTALHARLVAEGRET